MLSQPGHWASENLYSSQDCFWPLFTDRTNEVYRLNMAIKIKNQMKAVSNILTAFKTASHGFLKWNKFKLSFMGCHGQRDGWVKYLQGRSQGWFSCVVPQCYHLLQFWCPWFFHLLSVPMSGCQYRVCDEVLSCLGSAVSEGLRPLRMVWVRRAVSSCTIMKSSWQVDISAWNFLVFEHPLTFLIVTVNYRIIKVGKEL